MWSLEISVTGKATILPMTRDVTSTSKEVSREELVHEGTQPKSNHPRLLIPPMVDMTLIRPFRSWLWRAGWPGQLRISQRNLHLDQRQVPRN